MPENMQLLKNQTNLAIRYGANYAQSRAAKSRDRTLILVFLIAVELCIIYYFVTKYINMI